MAVGIGAAGFLGVALEDDPNTYEDPTRFFPIRSEGMVWVQNTNWRRVIRQTVDPLGAVAGDGNVEGDIDTEAMEAVLPYFLAAARGNLVKSGTAPNFVYTFTANHRATPERTLSITTVRNDVVFGYIGCAVGSMNFTVENGQLIVTWSMIGNREESKPAPTPVYATGDVPFGSGRYNLQIPTATQIFDADNFSFQVDDSGEPQVRLKDTLGAQFVKYGERTATISVDRDFESRAEYDNFKALTARSITLRAQKTAQRYIEIKMPTAIIDSYDIGLSGPGDLVRASTSYMGVTDNTLLSSYQIVVGTDEDIDLGS